MTTDAPRPTDHGSDPRSEDVARAGAARPPLHRPRDGVLGGVCAAVATHLDVDVSLVRLAAVALAIITGGVALLAYLVGWLLIPRAGGPSAVAEPVTAETPASRDAWRAVGADLRSLGDALRVAPEHPVTGASGTDRGPLAGVDAALTGLGDRLRDPQVQARARRAASGLGAAVGASLDGATRRARRD